MQYILFLMEAKLCNVLVTDKFFFCYQIRNVLEFEPCTIQTNRFRDHLKNYPDIVDLESSFSKCKLLNKEHNFMYWYMRINNCALEHHCGLGVL